MSGRYKKEFSKLASWLFNSLFQDICRLAARYLGFYQEDVSFPLNILFSDRYFGKNAYFCNVNSKRSNYGIEIISCRNPNI